MEQRNFRTARTTQLRTTELAPLDLRMVDCIEEFGYFVLHVSTELCHLDWTYTIGLVDTKAGAELITVGLPDGVSHSALDEAGKRMRAGVDLSVGRHADLIANVDCEFRPVARHWVKSLMP